VFSLGAVERARIRHTPFAVFLFFSFPVVVGVVVTLLLRVTQTEEKASMVTFFHHIARSAVHG
jgi:hypothetical protein